MVIEAEGYEVRTALYRTRGEEIFKQWRPDVVVSDLMLPDVDGVQLLRRFKEIDPSPRLSSSAPGDDCPAVEADRGSVLFSSKSPSARKG